MSEVQAAGFIREAVAIMSDIKFSPEGGQGVHAQ